MINGASVVVHLQLGHAWTPIRSVLDVNQIDISRRLIGRRIGVVVASERKRRPRRTAPRVSRDLFRSRTLVAHNACSWRRKWTGNDSRVTFEHREPETRGTIALPLCHRRFVPSCRPGGKCFLRRRWKCCRCQERDTLKSRLLCDWKQTMFPRRVSVPDVTCARNNEEMTAAVCR